MKTALEVYEQVLHQLGLHGRDSAILLPLFSLAFALAGYWMMTIALQAIGLPRVRVDQRGEASGRRGQGSDGDRGSAELTIATGKSLEP